MADIAALVKVIDKLDDALKAGHEIAELIPNSSRKQEIFQIGGGSLTDIANQQSMFMASYQLFNNTFGIEPSSFREWAKQFEECFPNIQKIAPHIDNNSSGSQPWGQPFENRPRIRILNAGDKDKFIPTYLYLEFFPERKNEAEVYFIAGTITQCVERIWQIWYLRQVIKQQDLAQILGQPPGDWIRKRPNFGVSLSFVCYNYKDKPFYKTPLRLDFHSADINVPFIQTGKLDYLTIRQALGGDSGMDWGEHRAIAWVADDPKNFAGKKGMPQVSCYGSTYEKAKANVERVLSLSFGKIVDMREGGKPDKSKRLNPNSVSTPAAKMYGHHMFILNSFVVQDTLTPGRELALAKMGTKKNRFEIWESIPPEDFKTNLDEILVYTK